MQVVLRRVGVHVGGEEVVRAGELGEAVHPVGEGQILHPPVRNAAMVGNDIHHYLQVALVALRDVGAVELVGAEARIDAVVVSAGVAVIGLHGLVVEQQRGRPDGRRPHRGDVVQVVDHALQVSAVTAEELRTGRLLGRVVRRVDRWVAVREAVRHHQIDHVGRGEALPFARPFASCRDLIGDLERLGPLAREDEIIGAGLGLGVDLHVDEQIVRTVGPVRARDGESGAVASHLDLAGGDVGTIDEQLQRRAHPRPPGQGFHPHDAAVVVGNGVGRGRRRGEAGDEAHGCKGYEDFFHEFQVSVYRFRVSIR